MTLTTGNHYLGSDDDDDIDADASLLVSPQRGGVDENEDDFKNPNLDPMIDEMMAAKEEEGNSLLLDETVATDDDDATTPAKRKFSYAAAMEQLDESWLAPTPNYKPMSRCGLGHCDTDESPPDLTMDAKIENGGQWVESPVKDDPQRLKATEKEDATNEKSSPRIAALAPAPMHPSPAMATTTAALLNDQSILSPNIELSAETTSAIFRYPSAHYLQRHHDQQQEQQQVTTTMTLHLGHPINESYDSVEQRGQNHEQEKISSVLVDGRDRVENDIFMKEEKKKADDNYDDESIIDFDDDLEGGEEDLFDKSFSNSELDTTLEEENVAAANDDETEGLTLTQLAAGCKTDSDVFLQKIEHTKSGQYDFIDDNEVIPEQHDTSVEENDTLQEEECDVANDDDGEEVRKIDLNKSTSDYHQSSPSESEENEMQEFLPPVVESAEIDCGFNNERDDIIEEKPELTTTSSRGDLLTFFTSADSDDTIDLSEKQIQNVYQASELDDSSKEITNANKNFDPSNDTPTLASLEDVVANDYLEYSTSNQPSSEVVAQTDLSFEGNSSLSASLDVSLSNIDREALFAGTFSQQLSPIRQNSSSPHDMSQRQDDEDINADSNEDHIPLPGVLSTSPISGIPSPHDCKPLLGADLCAEEEDQLEKSDHDPVGHHQGDCAPADVDSLEEYSAVSAVENVEAKKGSIFAVLSEVNADVSSTEVIQDELSNGEEDVNVQVGYEVLSDPSMDDNIKESVNEDAYITGPEQSPNGISADVNVEDSNDIELDDRNKSLEDLSSYQQSFNSTSTEFIERLRGAAESRKREVTKARSSMERKEQVLYAEKEDREVLPTLSEVAEEIGDELMKRTDVVKTQARPFKARPPPAFVEPESQLRMSSRKEKNSGHPARSTAKTTRGSKRKSSNALRPRIDDSNAYSSKSEISAKPPKRLLSGEDASHAKEINLRKLLQEDEERIRRESVFKARPLPATTLPRGHIGGLQRKHKKQNSKTALYGKENSAFKPSSSVRAEERAAYNEEKKAREEARRQEQIQRRNALIDETNAEIDHLKRFIR